MRITFLFCIIVLLIASCTIKETRIKETVSFPDEQHLKNITQLTFDGDNGEAYFNWDNNKLIFQSNRNGYECDKIWIMNIDGSGKKMVSPGHGAHTCSYFFPDNERIIFASTSHYPDTCPPKPELPEVSGHVWPLYPYDIFIANIDGSYMINITDNDVYDAEPIISSDGQRVVFGSKRFGDFNVYIMDSDGSDVKRLTDRIGYDGGPWFSPDGSKIVWRSWYPETIDERKVWRECMEKNYIIPFPLDIWVMNSDGSHKNLVLKNGATNFAPSWHPDGNRIIFTSNMDDWNENTGKFGHNFELYIINTDGSGLTRLTHNTVFDGFPMFSHDGKKLAFASNRNPKKPGATDIFIADWYE
jgi:Tol biopolymer transport system component